MHYEVCDCPVDSVHGVASRRDYPSLVQASSALITRLSDEYEDRCGERLGVDEETGKPVLGPDVEFARVVEAAVVSLGAGECADVIYAGTRYWIEAHDGGREGGFRERD